MTPPYDSAHPQVTEKGGNVPESSNDGISKDWPGMFPEQGIPKPTTEPVSVDEMRQAIRRAYRDDHTIHAVFQQADFKGMSGEDRYAMLAYYALRRVRDLEAINLRWVNSHPMPPLVQPR